MNKFFMAGVALTVLGVTANAADLGARRNQPMAPIASAAPAYTWTGLYAGVNVGGAFSSGNSFRMIGDGASFGNAAVGLMPAMVSNKRSGFAGGFQLGANYQTGKFVIGAETDLQMLGFSRKSTISMVSGTSGSLKQSSHWLGTTRVRLGFTPVDRLLVYGTGGVAYGNIKANGGYIAPGLANAVWQGSMSDTKFGWTLGVGAEYALTNNITAKLEYLYYDLGKGDVVMGAANVAAAGVSPAYRMENRGNIVRAGLNYKF